MDLSRARHRIMAVPPWAREPALCAIVGAATVYRIGTATPDTGDRTPDAAAYVHRLQDHPAAAFVAFWFAGFAFPVSVFVLGVVLTWIRAVPVPIGVLTSASAVAFPLSRIPREIAIAHVADLALLIPFAYLGIRMALGNPQPLRIAAPVPSSRRFSPDSPVSRRQ